MGSLNDAEPEETVNAEPEETVNTEPLKTNNGKIFISFLAVEAGGLAKLLAQKLKTLGKDVFYCKEDLVSGHVFPDILNQEVLARDIFVPLITPGYGLHSSNQSRWCLSELTIAYTNNKKIKPVNFLDPSALFPPKHIALQLGIFQVIPWLSLKECSDSLGVNFTLGEKWPERCLDIVVSSLIQFD